MFVGFSMYSGDIQGMISLPGEYGCSQVSIAAAAIVETVGLQQ